MDMENLTDPRRKLPSPETIAELYAQGLDYDDIAALYDVTRFGVYAAMKRAGIKVRGTRRPEARFWPKVDKHGPIPDYAPHLGSCWLWTGAQDTHGYGHFRGPGGVTVKAYRMAYELVIGPVPDSLHLDHLCRVRLCVRPFHLEPVEQGENNLRSWQARKSHANHTVAAFIAGGA